MSKALHVPGAALFFLALCLQLPAAALALASSPNAPSAPRDLAKNFAELAQQRPWTCASQDTPATPATGWQAEPAMCAWQDRLQMRRWSGQGGTQPGACVSAQAQWWTWARGRGSTPAGQPQGWRSAWHAQSLYDANGVAKRIVIIQDAADGQWSATEWRWNPSPRMATRNWQAGRWALLVARAAQLQQLAEAQSGSRAASMSRSILEGNLGIRAGEIGSNSWKWQADGLCLRVDAVGLDKQQPQLPYSVDDSRLEQRAAMQLQLARRYPKATWLTTFRLVPAAPRVSSGAKFYAIWFDNTELKGQLWIPTKGDGPLVRIRIDTALPGKAGTPALARAADIIEHELTMLATRWAYEHE